MDKKIVKRDAYICSCCGGHVNPVSLKCEYCGVSYKKENDGIIRIETFRNPVRTFRAGVHIDDFLLRDLGVEETSKLAVESLTKKLSESIPLCMTIYKEHNLDTWSTNFYGEIKMIEPVNVGVTL